MRDMLPAGYEIRLAHHGEIARLQDIERRSLSMFAGYEAAAGLVQGQVAAVHPVSALERANQDGRLWVALDAQSTVAGFALVIDLGLFAHLEELDVLPEHGRKGLGSALLETVCEWAFTRGFSAVTLSTFRDVPWNAPFYAQRGFSVVDAADQPPELVHVVALERQKGLRTELRVIMQREV